MTETTQNVKEPTRTQACYTCMLKHAARAIVYMSTRRLGELPACIRIAGSLGVIADELDAAGLFEAATVVEALTDHIMDSRLTDLNLLEALALYLLDLRDSAVAGIDPASIPVPDVLKKSIINPY